MHSPTLTMWELARAPETTGKHLFTEDSNEGVAAGNDVGEVDAARAGAANRIQHDTELEMNAPATAGPEPSGQDGWPPAYRAATAARRIASTMRARRSDLTRARRWSIAAGAAAVFAATPSIAVAAPGDLDTSFGGTGIVTTDVVPGNHDDGAAADNDSLGRAWIVGSSFGAAGERIALARYGPTGLESTIPVPISNSRAFDLDVHNSSPAYRALVVGSVLENGSRRPLVAAIRSSGVLDPSWSGDGLLSHAVPGATDVELTDIADTLVGGGTHVAAGRAMVAGQVRAFVARYTDDGLLDPTFSGDGMLTLHARRVIGGTPVLADSTVIEDVVASSGGRIILVGSATYPGLPERSALAMALRNDGTLDTSWGTGGVQHVGFGAGDDWFTSAAMQSGKVVLAGARNRPDSTIGYRQTAVTALLDVSGRLDLTYGSGNGITSWHPGRHLAASDVMISGTKIYVACSDTGGVGDSSDDDTFTVLRYTSNGVADFPWGGGDAEVRVNVNPGVGGYERANALTHVWSAVGTPSRILVAGTAWPDQHFRFGAVSLYAF